MWQQLSRDLDVYESEETTVGGWRDDKSSGVSWFLCGEVQLGLDDGGLYIGLRHTGCFRGTISSCLGLGLSSAALSSKGRHSFG